ncbi:Peroxisomal membrane protein pex16 [Puccinia graminis f. sp. tritici]|uniref:Peroxisomal membrane protein PEX16 n=1 Tax=Puccinia graminis f. sp. tritici TaxID=56615 RepID=A0A5B0QRR3_PUCGR|nr:Peroxisomal membrane protein pex16 [Puccinia graminis f. sp. tritici]
MSSTYQDFLLSNATRITSIESTLRSLTWFLPGRFKDAELASESLYTALNLLSLYHDRIITKVVTSLPSSQKPAQSSHARYTSAWCAVSSTYKFLAHALAIISHSQLLIEMVARRRLGSKRRWRVVLMLELIKALLRLKLVDLTSRMLVNPPLPERRIDPTTLEAQSRNTSTTTAAANDLWSHQASSRSLTKHELNSSNSSSSESTWVGKRTGIVRPLIANLRSPPNDPLIGSGKSLVNDYLSRKALTLEEVLKPLDLVRKSKSNKDKLAEIIWILRPVIYVLTINRFGHRHAVPFLCSLSLEYLSYSLRQSGLQTPQARQLTPPIFFASPRRAAFQSFVSELERNELEARRLAFWSYFLRGPLWVLWTKPKLLQISNKFAHVPIFNLISTAILDYTPLLDEYHYYVS